MASPVQEKSLVIVYHADCIDGSAAAWAVSRAWHVKNNITYIPYEHFNNTAAEDDIRAVITPGTALYFVDVVPEKYFLDELMSPAKSGLSKLKAIHILDHHKSAAGALKGYRAPVTGANTPALEIHIDPAKPSAAKMDFQRR